MSLTSHIWWNSWCGITVSDQLSNWKQTSGEGAWLSDNRLVFLLVSEEAFSILISWSSVQIRVLRHPQRWQTRVISRSCEDWNKEQGTIKQEIWTHLWCHQCNFLCNPQEVHAIPPSPCPHVTQLTSSEHIGRASWILLECGGSSQLKCTLELALSTAPFPINSQKYML